MKSSHQLGFAVALALGVAACGPKEEAKKTAAAPAAPAGVTVKIAHAGPLTGSIAHLGKDDENGEGIANEVEKTLKAAKVTIVGRERTTDKETDFKAILTKIKAKNPDVVFHGGMDATGGPMLKQARELGIKAVFAFGDGACTDEMGKLAGAAAEGMVCSQAGLPREAASKDFVGAFTSKYGEIKQYAPYFYDATNPVIEAMKKAHSTDPAKVPPEML